VSKSKSGKGKRTEEGGKKVRPFNEEVAKKVKRNYWKRNSLTSGALRGGKGCAGHGCGGRIPGASGQRRSMKGTGQRYNSTCRGGGGIR